jgi:hypothetical protein
LLEIFVTKPRVSAPRKRFDTNLPRAKHWEMPQPNPGNDPALASAADQEDSPMSVDLWVAALRILAVVLMISILWPDLFEPRRWARRLDTKADTRRAAR